MSSGIPSGITPDDFNRLLEEHVRKMIHEVIPAIIEDQRKADLAAHAVRFPPPPPRRKACHVGAPAVFALEEECKKINAAFGDYGCYLVGSALERPDHRDVDVRFIMTDDDFHSLFPGLDRTAIGHGAAIWEFDPRWTLINVAIAERLSRITGLHVDFQIQPQTWANARHNGPRSPLGLRFGKNG